MDNVTAGLEELRPVIEELMHIGGTPGLSLGVLQHGAQVYQANYGFRDTDKQLRPTDETIVPVCSLTKAVTAAAIGILVDEGKAKWDTLVKDALPAFGIRDETLQNQLTITDLLCHRAGMSWGDNLYIGTENNVLISGKDTLAYINSQTRLLPFRAQFAYNNLPFELAGKVIEALSNESYFDFVQHRILDPLGMTRTFLKTPLTDLDNVAKCYNVLDDGTAAQVPCVKTGDDWFGAPSAGIRSCIRDLTKLYIAFMKCFNDQSTTGNTYTPGYPLRQVAQLMSANIYMDQPSRNEASYGLGWARVQLPGSMGQIGNNPGLMPNGMPVVGKGAKPRLVIFHQGSLPGALAINILLPDTESAIIVSSNALALNDVPDWIGQLILEELLAVPKDQRNDYIAAAKESRAENLEWFPKLVTDLQKAQKNGTTSRQLSLYTGTYVDAERFFKIQVTLEDDKLYWLMQGLESEKFLLTHYQDDTFTWLQPRNELSKRGRWVGSDQGPDFWKVEFVADADGKLNHLYWVHDLGVPAVKYTKQ